MQRRKTIRKSFFGLIKKRFWFLVVLVFFFRKLYGVPDAITDLKVISVNWRSLTLQWTAPQSVEPVVMYEIRCSTYRILTNELDWQNNSSENSYPYRVVIDTSPLSGQLTSYTFFNLTNSKTYFFAIKSATHTHTDGELSLIDSNPFRPYGTPFNSQPQQGFNLMEPIGGDIVISDKIEFKWGDSLDFDMNYGDILQYEVYYSTFSAGLYAATPPSLNGATIIANISTNNYTLNAKVLTDNLTYYWRVKCIDIEGAYSWSMQDESQGKFVINHTSDPPSVVELFSPAIGSTVSFVSGGIFFDWSDAIDPDPQESEISYKLNVSSIGPMSGFNVAAWDFYYSSMNLTSILGDSWKENTTYWWYIMAVDGIGLTSRSTTGYFVVNNVNDFPIPNNLLSIGTTISIYPPPMVNTLNPVFNWTPTYDPDPYSSVYYQLIISTVSTEPEELNSVYYTDTSKLKYSTYYHLLDFSLDEEVTYYWRIKIWDEVYNDFSYSTTTYWFFTNSINLPPVAASLYSPLNNSTTRYFLPVFEWECGSDPDIDGGVSSQTLVYWNIYSTTTVVLTPGTTFYLPSQPLLNYTTYYWKVITYDNGVPSPVLSAESEEYKFLVLNNPPINFNLQLPQIGEIVSTSDITFLWLASSDNEGQQIRYRVDYSSYADFSFYVSSWTTSNSELLNILQDNTTFYWRVVAFDDEILNPTFCNATFYFVLDYIPQNPQPFNLSSPAHNSTLLYPITTFYWQATSDPDPFEKVVYEIKISTKQDFSVIYHSSSGVKENFYFLGRDKLGVNTTYYWYVIAISSRSGQTVSNSTFTFFVKNLPPLVPELFYPIDEEIITASVITLQWKESDDWEKDAFVYWLNVSTTEGTFWQRQELSSTTLTFDLSLQDDTTYYWYVVAIDTYSNISSSQTRVFFARYNLQPPTPPQLLDPLDKVIVLPYTFRWSTSTDMDLFDFVRYRIEISNREDFTTKVIISSSVLSQYVLDSYLLPAGTYYYRIIAYDSDFLEALSSSSSFVLRPYDIALLYPNNNEMLNTLPQFSWSKEEPIVYGDTITYRIMISSYSNFSCKIEHLTTSNEYKIGMVLFGNTTYYWKVVATDSYLREFTSEVRTFITPPTTPQDPSDITISQISSKVHLSWKKVEYNTNGSALLDLCCYNIYRTIDFTSGKLELLGYTTNTFFVDTTAGNVEYYYIIKTKNFWNVESYGNNLVRLYNSEPAIIFTSSERDVVIATSRKEVGDIIITISRKKELETSTYPAYYIISSSGTLNNKLPNFVEVVITKPDITKNYEVEYFDGITWQPMFAKDFSQNKVVIKTQYLGSYRLVEKSLITEELTVLGCSPKKKIITPNGDGINDEINFIYSSEAVLFGELYDISGKKVCTLKQKQNNVLYFDGKDERNNYILPGVYIYNIKVKFLNSTLAEKQFSGTIVIKY